MVYLKNQANLCAELVTVSLVFPAALELLQDHVRSGQGSSELAELVQHLEALPVRLRHCPSKSDFARPNNTQVPSQTYSHAQHDVRCILLPAKFKSNSPSAHDLNVIRAATPEGLGWTRAKEIARLVKSVDGELAALGVDVPLGNAEQAARAVKKSGEWTIVAPAASDMLQAQCCAVYLVNRKGFVNDKGSPVPLAGARLFESEAAANRTIAARGWHDAAVVTVGIQLEGLALQQPHGQKDLGQLGELGQALVEKQARALDEQTPAIAPGQSRRPRL